ncbi:hypothetical protein ZOSMA_472G00030 [Zostera marina]|uniref:F-box domain-containing protein n=1 Tax=Zostera marina TaxID=29655 RepID=A0A0K9P021_ZOSMR|nr:hypothetical protein ZOSMA_472G00030 [Zostera marina]
MEEKLQIIQLEIEKDRISSLPEQAINKILVRLSIKDAIRTSFLSRGWRYRWRSMPDLIFHSNSFSTPKDRKPSSLVRIYLSKVLQSLFLHKGNYIRRFEFSSRWKIISSKVDMWLDHLVCAGVQELKLAFTEEYYLIPSSVFRYDKLTTLDLKSCKIILPVSFNGFRNDFPITFDGFRNLTTLRLRSITFEKYNALETLINLCPLLEILDVRNLLGYRQRLILHAPNLQSLTIDGSLSYLCFKETRTVTNAKLILNPNEFFYDLTNVLNSLSMVHQLKFWSSGHSLFKEVVSFPLTTENIKFNQLKKLFLGVNLDCSKETAIAFCILKNCPSLSHLQIYCEHLEEEEEEEEEDGISLEEEDGTSLEEEDGISLSTSNEFWNDQRNFSSSSFDNLKVFDITNVHGSKSELRFIKYILGKAPLLKVSNIKIDWKTIAFGERKMGDILIQLLSFERISSAKVIIDEPGSN